MKKIKIPIPIYKCCFYIWVGSVEEAIEEYKKTWYYKNQEGHDVTFMREGGKLLHAKGIDCIIWIDNTCKDKKTAKAEIVSRLSHEILHAVTFELADRGCFFDNSNHEFYTYFVEYVTKEALVKLNLLI